MTYDIMIKKDPDCIVYAEDGDDFQEYCFEDGTRVPSGTPVGFEKNGEFTLFQGIFYENNL